MEKKCKDIPIIFSTIIYEQNYQQLEEIAKSGILQLRDLSGILWVQKCLLVMRRVFA